MGPQSRINVYEELQASELYDRQNNQRGILSRIKHKLKAKAPALLPGVEYEIEEDQNDQLFPEFTTFKQKEPQRDRTESTGSLGELKERIQKFGAEASDTLGKLLSSDLLG